jgi:hypothetical protein
MKQGSATAAIKNKDFAVVVALKVQWLNINKFDWKNKI